jgi:hypothetical protein
VGDAPSKCSPTWHSPKWTVEWTASCIQSDVGTPIRCRHSKAEASTQFFSNHVSKTISIGSKVACRTEGRRTGRGGRNGGRMGKSILRVAAPGAVRASQVCISRDVVGLTTSTIVALTSMFWMTHTKAFRARINDQRR